MRYIRLVAMCDEYDSDPGLVVKGTAPYEGMMADREGGLVAHDVLEHQNGIAEIGSVWDELEALGGIWQVRGRHGDLQQSHGWAFSPAENVASDVTRMFSEWLCEGHPPGGFKVGALPHLYDDDFQEIVDIARRHIWQECNDMGRGEEGEDEHGWTPELHAALEDYLKLALHRMRAGFRKAERRFGDGYGGWELYRAIKEAVAGIKPDFEGQEFLLAYGAGEARCYEAPVPFDY